jgi:cell division protein FtsI (penicillin-binding protein 3)
LRLATGVGLTTTPLHLAAAYGALANGGVWTEPTPTGDGRTEQVLHAATAARVLAMLESAVAEGTGRRAAIDGLAVAGKTGTLELDGGRWVCFAGVAPASAPSVVIYVGAEVPTEHAWGGLVAAPSFARIARVFVGQRP